MTEPTEIIMPLMGEGITEATLVRWLKSAGDEIAKEEPLLEISTDKVDTEIAAPASGFLVKTFADAGENVAVNSIIGYIADSPNAEVPEPEKRVAAAPAPSTAAATSTPIAGSSPAPVAAPDLPPAQFGDLRSSPLVRKMARDINLNLAAVSGRGLHGRITKKDVLNFVDKVRLGSGPASEDIGRLETTTVDGQEFLGGVPVRRERMSKMRLLTSEHMSRSVAVSPHATTVFEFDCHKIVSLREEHKASFKEKHGFNLTYTHFLAHATKEAIKEHPIVNCSVDGEDILHKDTINLGLAVAIESGLIVPVIKDTADMSLTELAAGANDIVVRARSKKLTAEDVQGGTFSITNPGLFGSVTSNPIINQPQVAILCIGKIVKKPVVDTTGEIVVHPMMHVGLTFDHRVVDGEGAAKFLATMQNLVETYSASLT